MKLRLPHKFQAALLAAIASVSFTTLSTGTLGVATGVALLAGQQAQANNATNSFDSFTGGTTYEEGYEIVDGLYLTSQMATGTTTATQLSFTGDYPNITGGDFFAGNYTVSIWVSAATLNSGNSVLFKYDDQGGNKPDSNAIVWTKTGEGTGTLTIGRGQGDFTSYSWSNSSTTSAITLGDDAMVNFTFAVAGATQSQTATVYVNGTKHDDLATYAGNMNGGGPASTMKYHVSNSATYGTITVRSGEKVTDQAAILTLMGVTNMAPTPSLVWAGTSGHNTWNTAADNKNWLHDETEAAYIAGSDATFGSGDGILKTVVVGETVHARNMAVQDSYTFTMGGNAIAAAGEVSIASGKTLTLDGAGTLSAGGGITGGGNITKTGSGMLALNATVNLGTLDVQNGDVTIIGTGDSKGSITALKASQGKSVVLVNTDATISKSAQAYKGNLTIGAGSTVNSGTGDAWDYNNKNTLTIETGGVLAMGGNRWTFSNANNSLVLAGGTVTGAGDGYGALDFYNANGIVRVTENSEIGASIRLRNNTTTFDVAEGKTLTISGTINKKSDDGINGVLAKSGAGTLVLSGQTGRAHGTVLNAGTIRVAHGSALGGTVTQNGGMLEIDTTIDLGTRLTQTGGSTSVLTGASLTLGGGTLAGTIQNAGTLILAGNITVNTDNAEGYTVAAAGEKTYSGGTSGFLSGDTTKYYLVRATGGSLTNSANITGVSSWTSDEAGNITFTRNATGSGIYYVNDVLTYSADTMGEATGFAIAAGASLTSAGISAVTSAKALHGAGTYVAPSVSNSFTAANGYGLGANVSLAPDWTGTVVVSGTSTGGTLIDFARLANGTISTVEIKGLNGWTSDWNGEIEQNIKLTNNGNTSAWTNGAVGSASPTATFSGKWSGTGTFERTNNGNPMNYMYTGDISGWSGKFKMTSTNTTKLTFAGDAHVVNAQIERAAGTLNVAVDTDVQFNNAVTATTFTVNAGRTATLNANTTVGGLTGAGNVVTPMLPPSDATKVTITLNGTGTGANAYTFDGSLAAHYLSKTGSGTQTFNGDVTLNRLAISSGTTYFNGAVSVDSQGYTAQGDQVINLSGGSTTYFNGPLSYTNGNNYAIILSGANTTAHFGGTTNLGTKHIGNQAGTLVVVDTGASLTLNQFSNSSTLTNNGAVTLEHGATLNVGILRSENLTNDGTINATDDVTVDTISGAGTISIATTKSLFYGTSGSTRNPNGSYAGTITAGRLQKWGTGTLTLSGLNAFSNETLLYRGTLEVAQVGSLGGQGVTTSANTSLIFNTADDGIYGGSITGTGSVTKSGEGNLVLTGANSYTGDTMVNQGTLAFQGHSTLGGDVTVGTGATLSLLQANSLTTTGNMTVGNGATLGLNASAPLTIGGSLTLGDNVTYNIGGVRHAGEYTVASATGALTFGSPGSVNLNSSIYSGTLSQKGNDLVLDVTQTGKVLHLLLLTGQSNSLGAVKGEPASDAMLTEYAPHTTKMWDGNMSGSIADPSVDTKNKAWNDTNKHWFTVQRQYTPTGKGVAGPADTPYAELTGQGDLRNAWGGATVMGPEYGFSYMMEKQGWNIQQNLNDIAIVKVSRDGGENTFWDPASSNSICPQILDTLIKAIKDVDAEQYPNISLDGLMFLQGETGSAAQGNNVRNVLTSMITYLQDGLAEAMQEGGELEGYAGKLTVSIGDSIILGEPAGPSRASTKPSAQVYKQWAGEVPNQVGFVYTQDLGLYTDNLHYDGNSQITIGARYAYTMAQVQGLDTTRDGEVRVRSQAYGDTMLGESPVSLNDDAAWWKSSGDKTAYSAESLARTVAVWDVSSAHMANGERITGNLALGGIRIEDPYSDGQNPGDHQAIITINSDSTGYALSIGEHGIELQQGDLTIGANVNATANQSWNTVYTPEGGTARTNHLAVTGTVTIGENVLLTFKEGSHIRFNSIVGTGSLTIGNGVTLAMSQADMLRHESTVSYSDGENGYLSGSVTLVDLDGGTVTLGSGVTGTDALTGATIAVKSDDSSVLLANVVSNGHYYVRNATVTYGNATDIGQATQIVIGDMGSGASATGATLQLDSAWSGVSTPIVSEGNGGAISIDSGVSLNATSVNATAAPVVLKGTGEYVGKTLGAVGSFSAADVFGAGVTLSDDWKGSVVLSGGNDSFESYTYMNNLTDLYKAGSTIVFNGLYAYFYDSYTVAANIEFRGTGVDGTGAALTYTAGNRKTDEFSGTITGKGDFVFDKNADNSSETITFTGDISGWEGSITTGIHKNATLNLTLGGKVTDVNAAITRPNGSSHPINVTVDADKAVAFNAALTDLNTFTVNSGKSAVLRGESSIGTLSGSGSFTVDSGSNVVTVRGGDFSGSISVISGKLVASSLGSASVTVGSGSTLDLAAVIGSGDLLVKDGATLMFNGADKLTVTGTLTLESGSRLDLARIFETQEAPVQANLFQAAPKASSLLSVGGNSGDSGLSAGGLLGAATTVAGDYILATANDISLADNVNLLNIAEGYTGSLSTQGDTGNKQLILTLAAASNDLIWDNYAETGKWNTTDANWHTATAVDTHVPFAAKSDVKFTADTSGQTVTMDGVITAGSMTVAERATVTIATSTGNTLTAAEGITVENGATMTLQGTGVTGELSGDGVVVGNAISSQKTWHKADVLGSGVTFGNDWTGTVKLTGTGNAEFRDMDLNEFGREGSKVEIDGVSGYFCQVAADHFSPEVVLGTNGLNIGNGYSTLKDKTPTNYYFDGGVSGAGDLAFYKADGNPITQRLFFTGDVTGWTGNLNVGKTFNVTANISGAANTVNAGISCTEGSLHLEVGDGSTEFTTTFNNAVSATDLTVKDNATAIFGQNATLTTTGGVTLDGTLDLRAMTSMASVGGALTLNDGSVLKFSGSEQNLLHVGSFTANSSSTLDMSGITFDSGTNSYTLLSSNAAIGSSVLNSLEVTGVTDPLGRTYELALQGNSLVLTFIQKLIWDNNTGNATWSTDSTDKNWHTAGAPEEHSSFGTGDSVKFVSTYDNTLSLGGDVEAGTMTVDTGAAVSVDTAGHSLTVAGVVLNEEGSLDVSVDADKTVNLGGSISGAGSLEKSGDGILEISQDNRAYTGGTTVSDGTLKVTNANGLGTDATVTVDAGAILEYTVVANIDTLVNNGTVNLNGGGKNETLANIVGISGTGDINITSGNGNRTYNITGDISDWTGTLTQTSDSGSMNLNISGTEELNADIVNTAKTSDSCVINLNLKDSMTVGGEITYTDKGPVKLTLGDGGKEVDATFTNNVKVSSFNMANAASSATLQGSTEIGTLSGAGSLTVDTTDKLVSVNGSATNYTGAVEVTSGTLRTGADGALGSGAVAVNGGTLDVYGHAVTNEVTVNGGALTNGSSTAMGVDTPGLSTLTVESGGMTVNGGRAVSVHSATETATMTLGGGVNITGAGTQLVLGDATLTGTGTISTTDSGALGLGGTTIASVSDVSIGSDGAGAHVVFYDTLVNKSANTDIYGAKLTYTGDLASNVEGGTYKDTVATEQTGNGFLTGGYFTLVDNQGDGAVTGNLDGSTIVANGFVHTLREAEGEDKDIVFDLMEVDINSLSNVYFINNGTVEYNADTNATGADRVSSIRLNGGNLQLTNTDLKTDVTLDVQQDGMVNIGTGRTLYENTVNVAPGEQLTLTGDGTYVMSPCTLGSNASLPEGVVLGTQEGNEFTGTVWLSKGTKLISSSLTGLATDNSSVTFNGVTGSLTNGTIAQNIVLEDYNSIPALALTNGTNGETHTFSGTITGDGTLARSFVNGDGNKGGIQNYEFTGDVSNWNGIFDNQVNGETTNLTFSGDVTSIGATIMNGPANSAGFLNVYTDGEKNKVFNQSVTASSFSAQGGNVDFRNVLNLSGDASASDDTVLTFHEMTNIGGNLSGNVRVEDGGNVTVAGAATLGNLDLIGTSTTRLNGDVSASGHVIVGNDASLYLNHGGIALGNGASLTVENGAKIGLIGWTETGEAPTTSGIYKSGFTGGQLFSVAESGTATVNVNPITIVMKDGAEFKYTGEDDSRVVVHTDSTDEDYGTVDIFDAVYYYVADEESKSMDDVIGEAAGRSLDYILIDNGGTLSGVTDANKSTYGVSGLQGGGTIAVGPGGTLTDGQALETFAGNILVGPNSTYATDGSVERTLTVNGGTLHATDNMTLGDNATFTNSGSGESLVIPTVDVDANKTLEIVKRMNAGLEKTGDGTLRITDIYPLSDAREPMISGDLVVNEGTVVLNSLHRTVPGGDNKGIVAGNIIMAGGTDLVCEGIDPLGHSGTATQKITLEAGTEDNLTTMLFTRNGGDPSDPQHLTLTTPIDVQGNTLIGGLNLNSFGVYNKDGLGQGSYVHASGTNNVIDNTFALRRNAYFDVDSDSELTLTGDMLQFIGSEVFTNPRVIKLGKGLLDLAGENSSLFAIDIQDGEVDVSGHVTFTGTAKDQFLMDEGAVFAVNNGGLFEYRDWDFENNDGTPAPGTITAMGNAQNYILQNADLKVSGMKLTNHNGDEQTITAKLDNVQLVQNGGPGSTVTVADAKEGQAPQHISKLTAATGTTVLNNATLDSATVSDGATLTLTEGKTVTLGSTIINGGTVNLNGIVNVENLAGFATQSGSGYEDDIIHPGEKADSYNGFYQGSTYYLVKEEGASDISVDEHFVVKYKGNTVSQKGKEEDTDSYYFQVDEPNALYYINNKTADAVYTRADDAGNSMYKGYTKLVEEQETQVNTSGIVMNTPGAVLTLASDLRDEVRTITTGSSGIVANYNGTVDIKNGVTLHQSDLSGKEGVLVALVGQGTFDLDGTTLKSVSSGLTEGGTDQWHGTVRASGTADEMDAAHMGNVTSTLLFDGVKGTLESGAADETIEYTMKIALQNGSGEGAVTDKALDNTFASNTHRVFSNSVSGSGDILMTGATAAAAQSIAFTGDVSGWKGTEQDAATFETAGQGTTNLKFSGAATEINVDINEGEGSTINLVAGPTVETQVFNGNITATNLTVEAGADTTLNNTTAISGLIDVTADDAVLNVQGTTTADEVKLGNGQVGINNSEGDSMVAIVSSTDNGDGDITGGVKMQSAERTAILAGTAGAEPVTRVDGANMLLLEKDASLQIENLVLAADTNVSGAYDQQGNLVISKKVVQEMRDTNAKHTKSDSTITSALTMTGTKDTTLEYENDAVYNVDFTSMCQMAQISGSAGTLVFDFTEMPEYYDWEHKFSDYGFIGVNFDSVNINASDLTVKALTKDASGQVVERIGYYYNGGNGAVVGSIIYFQVPEPTTSTLSLLALAALAARRRRKG